MACPSATSCNAVGLSFSETSPFGGATTFIEHWDGSNWSIVSSPNPPFGGLNELTGISCATTTDCMASGYYEAETGRRTLVARTLMEHWNGATWSIVPTPNRGGATLQGLFGVSCRTTNDCSAVGDSEPVPGASGQTLAEHWNGSAWSVVASPNPPASLAAGLDGVSCRGVSNCFAVGSYATLHGTKTLVEHWNGSHWKHVASPNPSNDSGLIAVSCPVRTSCVAVGSFGTSNGFFTLIERGA